MVYLEIVAFLFKHLVPVISYVLVSLMATMVYGLNFIIDNKIKSWNFFQSRGKLIPFFIMEIIIISLGIQFLAPFLTSVLFRYIGFIPAILLEFAIVFYVWFDFSFQFKSNWILVGLMEVPFILFFLLAFYGL
jgi:hypothetical protein